MRIGMIQGDFEMGKLSVFMAMKRDLAFEFERVTTHVRLVGDEQALTERW